MSWYFFGGFSAYWIVPSGRWRNHSGCSVTHGWSGEHWKARSRATSMPFSGRRPTSVAHVVDGAEVGVHRGVPALGRRRWPTGCRGRRDRRSVALFGPLRNARPMGWIGGR